VCAEAVLRTVGMMKMLLGACKIDAMPEVKI
jgi:hypothetical protein